VRHAADGRVQPGRGPPRARVCHFAWSSAVIDCHSLEAYTVALVPFAVCVVRMTDSPWARREPPERLRRLHVVLRRPRDRRRDRPALTASAAPTTRSMRLHACLQRMNGPSIAERSAALALPVGVVVNFFLFVSSALVDELNLHQQKIERSRMVQKCAAGVVLVSAFDSGGSKPQTMPPLL
jgi:hypothetical protein